MSLMRFMPLYWKNEGAVLRPLLLKWSVLLCMVIGFIIASYLLYHNTYRSLEMEKQRADTLQKKWVKLREVERLVNQDQPVFKELTEKNFYRLWSEAHIAELWENILQSIPDTINQTSLMETPKQVDRIGKHRGGDVYRHVSELKIEGYFWHENNWIDWMRYLNTLPAWVRESECELHMRVRSSENYMPLLSKDRLIVQHPPLEGACLLGLYWVY